MPFRGCSPLSVAALVTGSSGQDGSYLRDLIGQDKCVGCVNPNSVQAGLTRSNEVSIDLGDKKEVLELLREIRPKSIFHLAARHGPSTSMTFEKNDIESMRRLHVDATRNFLEAIETLRLDTHLVVAGSSRIFSPTERVTEVSEDTAPNPSDFYGESKLAAWELVRRSREEFGTRASFLILFNHESPRRPSGYFSSDLTKAIVAYLRGNVSKIQIRDPNALGDWSDARDVVDLMSKISQSSYGRDFVVSSGALQEVKEILANVFRLLGKTGTYEMASTEATEHNSRLYLVGANNKSITAGIWNPKFAIEQTIVEMVRAGLTGRIG